MLPLLLQMQKAAPYLRLVFFWFPVVYLSLLIAYNSLPYFTFTGEQPFILDKENIRGNSFWFVNFYIHVAAGIIALLAALTQFSSNILKKRLQIHKVAGKIYVLLVLVVAAPTGMLLAFFAKGGLWGGLGFGILSILWFYTTLMGLLKIKKGDVDGHVQWMIRSYALTLSALTFRLFHMGFHFLEFNDTTNYILSLWASNVFNILAAELVVYNYKRKIYSLSKNNNT